MDRQVAARIQQHLIDLAALCHQDTKRRPQHAAMTLANRRPDRCSGEVALGVRIFQRGFPGGEGFRLAEAGFDIAQPGDLPFAVVRTPYHRTLVALRRGSLLQACKRLPGGREQIGSPLQAHERTRLVVKPVGAVERHADRLPLVFEAEIAPPAGFGHAEQGIALARIRTRAVGTVQPTLHQFELLAEIGIVGHEDQPALLIEAVSQGLPIMAAAEVSAVGHAATDEAGRPAAGFRVPDPRICAPDVGMKRAQLAIRVGLEMEVI